MVKAFPRLAETIREKLPARTIRLVPGECFFVRSLDLPQGILPADIQSFAEFSIESLSPFTLEQLAWGFLYLPGAPSILVYAAYGERLRRDGWTELEDASHVYPAFLIGTGSIFDEPTVEFRRFGSSLSAVGYAPGNPIPEWVSTVSIPGSEDAEDPLEIARKRLLRSFDSTSYTVKDEILEITGEIVESNEGWKFTVNRGGSDEPVRDRSEPETLGLLLDEQGEWFADIRDAAFIGKKRKENDLARKIWFATLAAGIAAAFCLLVQIGFFATGLWINHKAGVVVAQTEAFDELNETLTRVEKIEQFVQEELKPFEMLETMNVERPRAVHFTEADTDGFNQLSVKGIGTNVKAFNQYTEALRRSPRIESVTPQVRTSQGRALFTLKILFKISSEESADVVADTGAKGAPTAE
jgi:hypothetical protein